MIGIFLRKGNGEIIMEKLLWSGPAVDAVSLLEAGAIGALRSIASLAGGVLIVRRCSLSRATRDGRSVADPAKSDGGARRNASGGPSSSNVSAGNAIAADTDGAGPRSTSIISTAVVIVRGA
jgi:hypothetical protein